MKAFLLITKPTCFLLKCLLNISTVTTGRPGLKLQFFQHFTNQLTEWYQRHHTWHCKRQNMKWFHFSSVSASNSSTTTLHSASYPVGDTALEGDMRIPGRNL